MRQSILIPAAGFVALATLVCSGCAPSEKLEPVVDRSQADAIRAAITVASSTGPQSAAAAAPAGSGWATLAGRFVLEAGAKLRPRQPLRISKDAAVCAPKGRKVLDQVLLVDSESNGIANVAVFLRKASRVAESAGARDEPVLFDQKGCRFLSHVTGMVVGQALEIRNSDPLGHNTNIATRGGGFNQTVAADQSLLYRPGKEESLPVSVTCNVHPWMKAYLLPRANAYFAVTTSAGDFQIRDLPAGEELEFQVWHEFSAKPGQVLVIDTDAARALKWSKKGRFKIRLEPDETRKIDLEVPASAFHD